MGNIITNCPNNSLPLKKINLKNPTQSCINCSGVVGYTINSTGSGCMCIPSYYGTATTDSNGNLIGCNICPARYYCPSGSTVPISCSGGYYCPAGSLAQIPCPSGYTCPSYSVLPYQCGIGTYMVNNYSDCQICPVGYSTNILGSSSCIPALYSQAVYTQPKILATNSSLPFTNGFSILTKYIYIQNISNCYCRLFDLALDNSSGFRVVNYNGNLYLQWYNVSINGVINSNFILIMSFILTYTPYYLYITYSGGVNGTLNIYTGDYTALTLSNTYTIGNVTNLIGNVTLGGDATFKTISKVGLYYFYYFDGPPLSTDLIAQNSGYA